MKRDADDSRKLNDDAEMGREARRASEVITEALYNGTSLEIYATEDGVFIDFGRPRAHKPQSTEGHFDLHAALCALADGDEA